MILCLNHDAYRFRQLNVVTIVADTSTHSFRETYGCNVFIRVETYDDYRERRANQIPGVVFSGTNLEHASINGLSTALRVSRGRLLR